MDLPTVKSEPVDDPPANGPLETSSGVDSATPKFPVSLPAQVEYIEAQTAALKDLYLASKRGKLSDLTPSQANVLQGLNEFLRGLEEDFKITPALKQESNIHNTIKTMANPDISFPEVYASKAKALYEKWEAQNWGKQLKREPEGDDSGVGEDDDVQPSRKKPKSSRKDSAVDFPSFTSAKTYGPPSDDRIWGLDGIMHGMALKVRRNAGQSKTRVLDQRYYERGKCKVFGHNGLTVGDWYPYQMVALARGGHGHSQAGISGDPTDGAWSVVVSDRYPDDDFGHQLEYCGTGSNDNTDHDQSMDRAGTHSLHTSIRTGKAVRVFRKAGGSEVYAPSQGIRYDGLYKVVSVRHDWNEKEGQMDVFRLVRETNQLPLDLSRPTGQELRDSDRIMEAVPSTSRGWVLKE